MKTVEYKNTYKCLTFLYSGDSHYPNVSLTLVDKGSKCYVRLCTINPIVGVPGSVAFSNKGNLDYAKDETGGSGESEASTTPISTRRAGRLRGLPSTSRKQTKLEQEGDPQTNGINQFLADRLRLPSSSGFPGPPTVSKSCQRTPPSPTMELVGVTRLADRA